VLGLYGREIIAGGNNTAIEDNQIVFARSQNNLLLLGSGENDRGREREAANQNRETAQMRTR
jgi:hypothetical protein